MQATDFLSSCPNSVESVADNHRLSARHDEGIDQRVIDQRVAVLLWSCVAVGALQIGAVGERQADDQLLMFLDTADTRDTRSFGMTSAM